jgi:hypothetical protein
MSKPYYKRTAGTWRGVHQWFAMGLVDFVVMQ